MTSLFFLQELLHRLVPDVNSVLNEHPVYKMHQRICWKNLYLEKLVEVEMRGPVWYSEGVRLAKELGAVKYLENSAVTKRGLKTGTFQLNLFVLFTTTTTTTTTKNECVSL
jgi:hypothetical protein